MSASYCSNCGAPATPGSKFCSYCGAAMPALPAQPAASPTLPAALPSSAAPGPGVYASSPPSRPPPKRSKLWIVAVVIVVILLVVGVFAYLALSSVPPVQVNNINIWAPDNVCGLNSNPTGFYGFNSSTGANQTLDFFMPNYNSTACTIHSASTNTSGFVLSGIQVPVTIPGNGTGSMNITITSPTSSFNGNLNLVLG